MLEVRGDIASVDVEIEGNGNGGCSVGGVEVDCNVVQVGSHSAHNGLDSLCLGTGVDILEHGTLAVDVDIVRHDTLAVAVAE